MLAHALGGALPRLEELVIEGISRDCPGQWRNEQCDVDVFDRKQQHRDNRPHLLGFIRK